MSDLITVFRIVIVTLPFLVLLSLNFPKAVSFVSKIFHDSTILLSSNEKYHNCTMSTIASHAIAYASLCPFVFPQFFCCVWLNLIPNLSFFCARAARFNYVTHEIAPEKYSIYHSRRAQKEVHLKAKIDIPCIF